MIWCNAQNISSGEYFIDSDPGQGAGTPFAVTAADTVKIENFKVTIPALSTGFHNLCFRFKNVNGIWSQFVSRPFFVEQIPVISSAIIAAEYFMDDDPGTGNGIPLSLSGDDQVMASFNIPLTTQTVGFHNLAVRVKNVGGNWSIFESRSFVVMESTSPLSRNIVAAEYFIDTDPGVGLASPITVPQPTQLLESQLQLPLPQGLSAGQHFLFARVKDNLNRWSLLQLDTFNIGSSLPVTGMVLSGKSTDHGHQLYWTTYTEINTSHFIIEKSVNGIDFSAIGKLAAQGNSVQAIAYTYLHKYESTKPQYYRLRQEDKDGKFIYSNIILLDTYEAGGELKLYPNPANHTIILNQLISGSRRIATIYNVEGHLVKNMLLQGNSISVADLPNGGYIIKITNGIDSQTAKFIKQ